jgi:hypothetical protein
VGGNGAVVHVDGNDGNEIATLVVHVDAQVSIKQGKAT